MPASSRPPLSRSSPPWLVPAWSTPLIRFSSRWRAAIALAKGVPGIASGIENRARVHISKSANRASRLAPSSPSTVLAITAKAKRRIRAARGSAVLVVISSWQSSATNCSIDGV